MEQRSQPAESGVIRAIQAPHLWTTTIWLVFHSGLSPTRNRVLGALLAQRLHDQAGDRSLAERSVWQSGGAPEWLASSRGERQTLLLHLSVAAEPDGLEQAWPLIAAAFALSALPPGERAERRLRAAQQRIEAARAARVSPQAYALERCATAIDLPPPDSADWSAAAAEADWRRIVASAPLSIYLASPLPAQPLLDQAAALARPWIGGREQPSLLAPHAPLPPAAAPAEVRERRPHAPDQLAVGWRSPYNAASPDYPAWMAALGLLGMFPRGRIARQLRERTPLAYAMALQPNRISGTVTVHGQIVGAEHQRAFGAIDQALGELQAGDLSDAEVRYAGRMLDREHVLLVENPRRLLDHCLTLDLLGAAERALIPPDPPSAAAITAAARQLRLAARVSCVGGPS